MIEYVYVAKFICFKKISVLAIMTISFLLINMFVLQCFIKQFVQ